MPSDPRPELVFGVELEHARVLWSDLVRPLREFLSGLADGPRDALTRWSAVEEVLALHGIESSGSIRSRPGTVTLTPSGSLADALLRACSEVLGPPAESRGDALVRWCVVPRARRPFVVSYRAAPAGGDEVLSVEWRG